MNFSDWLIASDIDGTYLNHQSQFVPRNLEAIARFRDGGGLFTFASGRNGGHLGANVGVPAEICNAPGVMCNGMYLYDFRAQKIVEEYTLSVKDALDILEFCKTRIGAAQYRAMARGGVYTMFTTGRVGKDISTCVPGSVLIGKPETWPKDDWYKMVFRGSAEEMQAVRAALLEVFGDRFTYTCSEKTILELIKKGRNKAAGIASLRRLYPDRTIIACGDFENDIEMLQAADIAVCPANGGDMVKAIADYVLCDCGEGLIADVIEHIAAGDMAPKKEKTQP